MFDRHIRPLIDVPLNHSAKWFVARGISANMLTAAGLTVGLIAALAVWQGWFVTALIFVIASRLLDGLDGAVARATMPTDVGGYLDILADFIFYAAIPLGFVFYDAVANALMGALLLASFFINAASFLGFAVLAEKHGASTQANGIKSHYHATGLIEGSETIALFVICLIWPSYFASFALIFTVLIIYTIACRTRLAWRVFSG